MQVTADNVQTFVKIDDNLAWGIGGIQPQPGYTTTDDLIEVVLQSLAPVAEDEQPYSACTDGRPPVRLLDGSKVPVREQMVGADIVSAFYVAECLGQRFYKDPAAPVADRVREVAEFLKSNGIIPSSHLGCGAATAYLTIAENVIKFNNDTAFASRRQALLPAGIYDQDLHQQMIKAAQERLQQNVYNGLTADTFIGTAKTVGGNRAVCELRDDGRGVHGHMEEAIVRVRVPGYAIDEAKVSTITNGRQVFGLNDQRLERIARLFGRGADQDYRTAYMALEDFANAAHGTLAKNLPTYIVGR